MFKKLNYFLSSIFLFTTLMSCNEHPNLDGFWYTAQVQNENGEVEKQTESVYLSIKGDSFTTIIDRLYRPLEIYRRKVSFKDSSILFDSTTYNFHFSNDSLILIPQEENPYRISLLKVKASKNENGIENEIFKGAYELFSNDNRLIQTAEFLTDSSLIVEESPFCSGTQLVRWKLYEFNDLVFFRSNAISKLTLIQSWNNQSIIMSNPRDSSNKIRYIRTDRKIEKTSWTVVDSTQVSSAVE